LTQSMRLIRKQLGELIKRAESDEEFRERLRAHPEEVLREHGIGAATTVAMLTDVLGELGGDVMVGCNDGTCFSSGCPDTCYVTVCGTTDCGETFPNAAWGREVERWLPGEAGEG